MHSKKLCGLDVIWYACRSVKLFRLWGAGTSRTRGHSDILLSGSCCSIWRFVLEKFSKLKKLILDEVGENFTFQMYNPHKNLDHLLNFLSILFSVVFILFSLFFVRAILILNLDGMNFFSTLLKFHHQSSKRCAAEAQLCWTLWKCLSLYNSLIYSPGTWKYLTMIRFFL